MFFEDYLQPNAYRVFEERGILLHGEAQSIMTERCGERFQAGPVMMGDEYVALLDVQCEPDTDSVNALIEKLDNFLRFFSEYQQHKIIGAVAGITVEESLKTYAYQKGLFVIAQSGETITILNDAKFQPKAWQQCALSGLER